MNFFNSLFITRTIFSLKARLKRTKHLYSFPPRRFLGFLFIFLFLLISCSDDKTEAGGGVKNEAPPIPINVEGIFSTDSAFAFLKTDGSVITWGDSDYGADSSSVTSFLASDVSEIFSTNSAFAALKTDGSVVTWGDSDYGADSSSVTSNCRT